ncbi:MAG: phosphomannomutase [Candidatus Berkelbacteria bacterium Licking1014_7]|uniref:Phosphomannomutase n=1 Tax=Candidatus Berkelbacteria bacterium Licking1014_7 TaxID=2017147 RepID=A0A554LHX5_9BACT|nr:MAG: phosphomannomutase [Candidatus Berkelbacteria bacterium Licking1014_7]
MTKNTRLPKDLIISISGIRGIVGQDLNKKTIKILLSGYIKLQGKGLFILAGDSRSHTPKIQKIVAETLIKTGCDVIDAGIQPTPTVNINVPRFKANGGIMISASHNPSEYNGLKFFDKTGHYLDQKKLDKLLSFCQKEYTVFPKTRRGKYTQNKNIDEAHLDLLEKISDPRIKQKKFKVIVDTINGAGCDFTKKLLTRLGCEYTIINNDPKKPFPHMPEPNFENLQIVNKKIIGSNFDIGFATDPDCDRIIILTPKKGVICEEYSLALSVLRRLKQKPSGAIVINYATSLLNEFITQNTNFQIIRTAVGEHNVYAKMVEKNAVLAGEGNGGVMDPRLNSTRDGFTGIVHILSLLARENKTIDEIVDALPKYEIIKDKIPVKGLDLKKIYANLEKQLYTKNCQIRRDDGIWIGFMENEKLTSWLLFRPSNTEPIARIIAETSSQKQTRKLINLVKNLVQNTKTA